MAWLKKALGVVFGLVVLAVGAGYLLPSDVHVERDIIIDAPPEQVFGLISDFNAWDAWSPWAELDPNAAMTISGAGVGQRMAWDSADPKVGKGYQEVTDMRSPNLLKTHLDFGDNGMADATFTLTPEADKTHVTWSLDSDSRAGVPLLKQPLATYFGFAMDTMVGQDYETGLQNLKAIAEG